MKPRQASQDNLQSMVADFKKGTSTAKMLIRFYRERMKIPHEIPDTDALLKKGARIYAVSSGSVGALQSDYTSQLNSLNSDIQIHLSQLNTKTTLSRQQTLAGQFKPLSDEANNLIKNRDQLKTKLVSLISEQESSVPKVLAEIKTGQKTETDLKKVLQEFSKRQKELAKETSQLIEAQKTLKAKLKEVNQESRSAAATVSPTPGVPAGGVKPE